MSLVIGNIHALARLTKKIPKYKGPYMKREDYSKTRSLYSASLLPKTEDKKELVNWISSHLSEMGEHMEVPNLAQIFWLWFLNKEKDGSDGDDLGSDTDEESEAKHPLPQPPGPGSKPASASPEEPSKSSQHNQTKALEDLFLSAEESEVLTKKMKESEEDFMDKMNIPDEVVKLIEPKKRGKGKKTKKKLDPKQLGEAFEEFGGLDLPEDTDGLTEALYASYKGLPQPKTKSRSSIPWFDQMVQQSKQSSKVEQKKPQTAWIPGLDPLLKGFGVKSDMNKRGLKRAKKSLQMEDTCFASYPFASSKKMGLFCVFDGHGGAECSEALRSLFPQELEKQLSKEPFIPEDMLKPFETTFLLVDKKLVPSCEYIGSTATTVFIWQSGEKRYLQSANVGDSTAFLGTRNEVLKLSRDHKPTQEDERRRMENEGIALTESQTRVGGLSVSRAIGDHFLKAEKVGVIGEPYVSNVMELSEGDSLLILASDGLWDVMSGERAMEIAQHFDNAEEMVNGLMQAALVHPRCVDNISIIVVQL